MAETQMKQIGGIWIDEDIYVEFKSIAKKKGFRKPNDVIVSFITDFVKENKKTKTEWIDRNELVEEIQKDESIYLSGYSAETITKSCLVNLHNELPEDCVKGGNEHGKKVLYHKDKTLEFLRNNPK